MNSSGDSAQKGKTNQNIQVYVRVRPTNTREKLIRSNEVVEVQGARDVIAKQMLDSRTTKRFTFDRAFGMDSQQHEVYASVVSPMIDEVLAGYNCTVFAYGQTGTGKTYTMVGEEQPTLSSTQEDASNVGIIPRALNHLFDELRLMEVEFAMRVSYLELYNEELCDLLSTDDTVKIRIFDDVNKKGSVIVQGLEEIPVRCKSDVYRLLAKGQDRRRTAATLMNAQSSRSHTVFSILVHIKENGNDGEEMLKIGKLNLVDLAGSENISKAGTEKGIRTRESVNINQSLLTLGRVITALVERTPHIPYRESKLTRLLQESLGGRTKTSIIATVSPGHKDLEETLSTLDYAHRAKNIQNKPEINQRLTKKVVLKEYSEEIDRLKRDLIAAREKNGIYLASDTYNDMLYKMEIQQKELNEKITVMKTLKEDLSDKNRMFDECNKNLEEVSAHLVKEQGKTRITEAELSKTKRNLRKVERHHEEKKHIVMCLQKTEEALTEHAKQLIEVADEASSDTYGLIESINRRKEVEENAVTASDQLMKNLSNNIIEMRYEMEQLKMKHKESTKLVVADLEENTKMSKQFAKSISGGLKELKDLRDGSGEQIQNIVGDWVKSTRETSKTDYEKSISWMRHIEQQQITFHSTVSEKIRAMELLLAKEKAESEGMRVQLLGKINEQNAAIENFCGELKDKIEKHSREFIRLSLQTKQQTDAQKLKLQEIKRLLKEVEDLDCDEFQQEMSSLNSNLLSAGTENIKAFGEQNSSILGEKIGCLKNVEDSHAEMCGKLTDHLASAAKIVREEDDKIKVDLKHQIDLSTANETRFKAQLMAVENAIVEQVKQASNIDGLKCDGITDQLKTENSRASVKAQEVKSLVQHTLTGLVQAAESIVCDKLLKCSGEIDQFQEEDVLKYKSSGETPARKDFKFNKNLVATSPHDRIIKRLRMESGLSDNSQQLDASLLEVIEPDANSTPLRIQNISGLSGIEVTMCLKDVNLSKIAAEGKENHQMPTDI